MMRTITKPDYCRRLSQSEAYARLLAMRQGLYEGQRGVLVTGLGEKSAEESLPLWAKNLRRQGARDIKAADEIPESNGGKGPTPESTGKIPVAISTGAAGDSAVDDQSVKTAVQNFRNILIDIEKQQALQRDQLKRVIQ
jgi:hypothetical protein